MLDQRVERFLKLLPERRLVRLVASPLLFRFAWKRGSSIRPPIYQGLLVQIIFFAFPVLLLLFIWNLLTGSYSKFDFGFAAFVSMIWGMGRASGVKGFKKKLNLPDQWDSI